jgi:hypothetical protein
MSIVELKIALEDVEPAVSRTLQVPLDIRLDRLHLTIQQAMGWYNCHLYSFIAGEANWGVPDPDWGGDDLPANKSTLRNVIEDTGVRTLDYVYDFGDNWEHRIKIGNISDTVPGELYPKLTGVIGKCPPEDVGGIPGYEAFLEAIADPAHSEHEEMKEWYGRNFDPHAPETKQLKAEVLRLAKKWKPRKSK